MVHLQTAAHPNVDWTAKWMKNLNVYYASQLRIVP